MPTRKRLSAGLLATALAAGGTVMAVGSDGGPDGAGALPAPPLLEMSEVEPVVPDDGLERVIVRVPSTVAELEPEENIDVGAEDDVASRPDLSSTHSGLIGALPDDADRIVINDSRLGYVNGNGDFIAFGDRTSAGGESATGAESPSAAATMVDTLTALPGVESVELISDTSFAVRTSDPARLDSLVDLGVTVADETYFALTADPYETYQWSLENTGTNLDGVSSLPPVEQSADADIDGVEARLGATGRGVVVAIVDSGVDLSHPELAHAGWINPGEDCDSEAGNGIDDDGNGYVDDCSGWDFGDDDRQTFDGSNNAHGTHVAGIVAARSGNNQGIAGIAPDAKIMDLKVSDRRGAIPSSSIARAVRYAVDNGADVVNLSLGSEPGAPLAGATEIAAAVDYARVNGVLLVVAAGNNGVSLDSAPVYPASLNTSNMVVVGASDPTDHRTSFSNYGSALDLFAPGLYILSTTPNGQLAFQSGTSQASPTVAGAAALAIESLGTSSPSAVIDRLTASADSVPNLQGQAADPLRVNSARAVGVAVGAAGTPNGAGDSGGSAGSVGSVTIRGLAGDETGRVSASISIAVEDEALDEPFQWEASLYALEGGRLFAIPDHDVTAGPSGAVQQTSTDERGAVLLATDVSPSAQWESVLPGGTYALLVEAVPESDPDLRLGDGFLATFAVAGADGEDANSGDGDDGAPGGDTSSGEPTPDGTAGGSDGPTDGPSGRSSGDGATGDGPSTGDPDGSTSGDPGGSGGSDPGSGDAPGGSTGGTTSGGSSPGGGTGDPSSGSGGSTPDPGAGGSTTAPGNPAAGAGSGTTPGGSIGSDSAANGDWAVVDISPQTGFVDSFNYVYVFGSFTEPVTVWFGNSAARTISQTESLLIVETARHARAGAVDVTLHRQDEVLLRLPRAYEFVALDGGTGGGGGSVILPFPDGGTADPGDEPATGGSGTPGATGGSGDATDPTDPGESSDGNGDGSETPDGSTDDGDTDGPIGDPGTGDDSPTGDGADIGAGGSGGRVVADRSPRPRASINGEPVELANGLIGVPVKGVHVVGPIPSCGLDACRARRI